MATNVNLALGFPVDGTANLPLGRELVGGDSYQISIEATLAALQAELRLAPSGLVAIEVVLPALTAQAQLIYDVLVFRGPQLAARSPFAQAPVRRARAAAVWEPSAVVRRRVSAANAEPLRRSGRTRPGWARPPARLSARDIRIDSAEPSSFRATLVGYSSPPERHAAPGVRWEPAAALADARWSGFVYPPPRRRPTYVPWALPGALDGGAIAGWAMDPLRRQQRRAIPWDVGLMIGRVWPKPVYPPPAPPPPGVYVPTGDLSLWCPFDGAQPVLIQLGRVCQPPGPPPQPARRVYIVVHDIVVLRLPDRTPIRAQSVTMELDVDSWAWGLQATLLGRAALDAVVPDGDGSPTQIEVAIDGYVWRFVVEQWSEGRAFGERTVRVAGRSLVALLSEPHVQPSAFVANGDLLAQQIAAAQLPFGYTLDWLGPDWIVPSGAYTQSGRTPAQAVAAIAQAAGLMAEPLRDGLGWTVRKVYSTPPWQWGGAIPDRVVGQSVILQLDRSLALANRGQANAVVVHGGEVQGILASVRIAATAGDRLAATYSDPLITAVAAAQAAGERILAREYRQPPIASLELPMGPAAGDFALINLGDLVQINVGGDSGLAVATALSVAATVSGRQITVRQRVGFGEVARNPAAQFADLTAPGPVTPGEVQAVFGDGTAVVGLVTGGSVRAPLNGLAAAPGARVYVRGGQITGPAPTFPSYVIDV